LNNYDQETVNFYRWQVQYSANELSELVKRRSGTDYGLISDLVPVQRGTSGRLVKLRIVGSKKTKTIGKELEIRRSLSESHLYSSAFVVDKVANEITGETDFVLRGAGWGHGVGLCQIGAAVMGEKGYGYNEILLHYFIGASIEKRY
jgi:SpoIID/LytB domain protein